MQNNRMGVLMSFNKYLAGVIIAGAALIIGAGAEAKGPQGVGAGATPANSASPNSQGIGSNSWTQPPGWDNAKDTKGWGGGSETTIQPPGFDSAGKATGWNGDPLPPGLEKRQ
jgi:hypothetical protein